MATFAPGTLCPFRARRLGPAIAAAALLAAAGARAAPEPMTVSVGRLPCPSRARVEQDIRLKVQPARPDEGLVLLVDAPERGRLRIRLSRGEDSVERNMKFSRSDCAELPQTVAALVDAWLARVWPAVPPASAAAPAEPEQAPAPARTPVTGVPAPPPPPPPPPDDGVRLAAFGGAFVAAQSQSGGIGGIDVDLAVDGLLGLPPARWGVALSLWTESRLAFDTLPGGTSTRHPLELVALARYAFRRSPDVRLDVAAGPAVLLLDRRGPFSETYNRDADLALIAALRGTLELWGDLSLVAQVGAQARMQRDEFVLPTSPPKVVTEQRVRAMFLVGLGWRLAGGS